MKQKSVPARAPAEQVVKDIRRATRRHFSAEDKIRIVLEGLRGEESIAELCRREGIVQNLYYRWSKDFLEAGKKRLAGDTARAATSDEVKDLRREANALKEVVAELTLAAIPSTAAPSRTPSRSSEADPETEAVMMIGEIGGPQEAEAAQFIRDHMTKPVAAYIAGLTAPKGRRSGHAGAIISAFGESADEKVEILQEAGVRVAPNPSELGTTVAELLARAA